ncbi:hypothetical protein FF125_20390 [Aureibaculum algae]|uniref:Lipoprotein n=1 Tax=Aureibaculum algae TaxID=2584122 RepID=A0A5B7TV30_9FLAO|nr:hypothetical protein [Aureibaculum algae]QCX40685.1 hypothetical protein FF125_20390 [Aureibaculum algae]
MKKVLLCLVCIVILSCKNDLSKHFEENKDSFIELSQIIKKNDHYFFNNSDLPRWYGRPMFQKRYEDLEQTSKLKSLDIKNYNLIQKLLKKLGIYKFYSTKGGDLFFNFKKKDYFIYSKNYFIAFLESGSVGFENFGDCYIGEIEKIENKWYKGFCKSSPAN